MSDLNDIVTVVNRTSKLLKATDNGRPYDLPPGETKLPRGVALRARFQNPVMGRGTPLEEWSSKSEYLLGIVECGDDCSPIEQTDAPQRWDTEMVSGSNAIVVRPRGGNYTPEVRQPRSADGVSGFTKLNA